MSYEIYFFGLVISSALIVTAIAYPELKVLEPFNFSIGVLLVVGTIGIVGLILTSYKIGELRQLQEVAKDE